MPTRAIRGAIQVAADTEIALAESLSPRGACPILLAAGLKWACAVDLEFAAIEVALGDDIDHPGNGV